MNHVRRCPHRCPAWPRGCSSEWWAVSLRWAVSVSPRWLLEAAKGADVSKQSHSDMLSNRQCAFEVQYVIYGNEGCAQTTARAPVSHVLTTKRTIM